MKKKLALVISFIWIGCFSQAITVDTKTYSVTELVNNILVNKENGENNSEHCKDTKHLSSAIHMGNYIIMKKEIGVWITIKEKTGAWLIT